MNAISQPGGAATVLAITLTTGCIQPAALPLPPDPGDLHTNIVRVRSTTMALDVHFESEVEQSFDCRTPSRVTLANGRYRFIARAPVGGTFGVRTINLDEDDAELTLTPPRTRRLPGVILTPLGSAGMTFGVASVAIGSTLAHPACSPFEPCAPPDPSGAAWIGGGIAAFVTGLAVLVAGVVILRESRSRVDVRYVGSARSSDESR